VTLTSTPVDVGTVPGTSSHFSVPALLLVIIGAFLALMLWARQSDQR
jgi:Mg2+ and Co2+ transporter CorA